MERTYTFPRERTYTFHTYEEAVAACWAAYRAKQPATVTAPEPTLEAQLAEAREVRDALHTEWFDAVGEVDRISRAIAARDGKAGAK
jgi:hypothetical protein